MVEETFSKENEEQSFSVAANSGLKSGYETKIRSITSVLFNVEFIDDTKHSLRGDSRHKWIMPVFYILPLLLTAIYGGIHLTAWNSVFPTSVEGILWKIACIIIMASFPWLLACLLLFSAVDGLSMKYLTAVLKYLTATCAMASFLVVPSRVYVIVESFLSLRRTPIGVYWVPVWLQTLPHV